MSSGKIKIKGSHNIDEMRKILDKAKDLKQPETVELKIKTSFRNIKKITG